MRLWLSGFFKNFINGWYFPDIQVTDIIEIFIVAVIVYEIMLWIKNTKAWMLLRGIIILSLFILAAAIFQMHTILFLAKESINVLAIAAVVVFQPELRRALEKLGEKNLLSTINPFDKNKENQRFADETIEGIVSACFDMGRVCTGALKMCIRDRPTTGLHFADVHKLTEILRRLSGDGNTVVVIEHNLDVIKTADYIIDIGPEGGDKGGTIVAVGTPEEVTKNKKSYTDKYIDAILKKN